jgi:hypothetical protein
LVSGKKERLALQPTPPALPVSAPTVQRLDDCLLGG